MLEQGNPAVFTQGVRNFNDLSLSLSLFLLFLPPSLSLSHALRAIWAKVLITIVLANFSVIQLILLLAVDHHGNATSKTDPRGHRGASR